MSQHGKGWSCCGILLQTEYAVFRNITDRSLFLLLGSSGLNRCFCRLRLFHSRLLNWLFDNWFRLLLNRFLFYGLLHNWFSLWLGLGFGLGFWFWLRFRFGLGFVQVNLAQHLRTCYVNLCGFSHYLFTTCSLFLLLSGLSLLLHLGYFLAQTLIRTELLEQHIVLFVGNATIGISLHIGKALLLQELDSCLQSYITFFGCFI